MTANELADKVIKINDAIETEYNRIPKLDEAAQMLRQQAQEIEKLKTNLHNVIVLSAKEIEQLKSKVQYWKAREK
jgi:dephospho-CoA kinase